MALDLALANKQLFPCPVCMQPLRVRQTKKKKPYVVCDPCGVQMFVRNDTGMVRFERLVSGAEERNVWARLEKLQQRYQKKCPRCGKRFWVSLDLAKSSWFDGAFIGYRCPEADCDGIAKDEEEDE